jgi:hypothetical protein
VLGEDELHVEEEHRREEHGGRVGGAG